MASTQRMRRVAEQIQQEISQLLLAGLKDPRVGFVTITSVEMSPDLQHARIYYTVVGDAHTREETQLGLESATPYIRQHIGRTVRLRYTPHLRFSLDQVPAQARRIEAIIEELHTGEEDEGGDSPDSESP